MEIANLSRVSRFHQRKHNQLSYAQFMVGIEANLLFFSIYSMVDIFDIARSIDYIKNINYLPNPFRYGKTKLTHSHSASFGQMLSSPLSSHAFLCLPPWTSDKERTP
jgi:hypothetical protein